jgi:hypothetical protein
MGCVGLPHTIIHYNYNYRCASIANAGEFLKLTSSSSSLESLSITFYRIVPTPEQLHTVLTVMQ